jgi:acyl-CoA thioesterase I
MSVAKSTFTSVCILSLLLFACSAKNPTLPHLSTDAKILAFGDSLTYGTGSKDGESYPAQLQALIDREVINAGIPGEITREGLLRLPSLLNQHRPELVILCHGGNDLLRKNNQTKTRSNLRQMIEVIQQYGASVILLGVPRPKLFLLQSAEFYSGLAKEFNIPIENQVLPTVLSNNSLKSDTIHPNANGYRKIAEAIHSLLLESKAI